MVASLLTSFLPLPHTRTLVFSLLRVPCYWRAVAVSAAADDAARGRIGVSSPLVALPWLAAARLPSLLPGPTALGPDARLALPLPPIEPLAPLPPLLLPLPLGSPPLLPPPPAAAFGLRTDCRDAA